MSASFLTESQPAVASSPPRPAPPRRDWLREPLLHFVALGGLLFAIDHVLVGRADDPRTIVVGADVDHQAIETFKAARGHAPNAEELTALRQVWLDNEVLYREGLALAVDRGDDAIRERVIFKALSVIDSDVKVPAADDATLRAWFEKHRDKYDEPPRFDFEEAALAGDSTEAVVVAFVKALNSGTPGDAQAGLRVFKGRPEANLVQSYGPALARALAASKPGQWQALRTRDGWRAMRLVAVTPARPAVFALQRNVIFQDWTDAVASEQRTAAVRALAKKYTVKRERPAGAGHEE